MGRVLKVREVGDPILSTICEKIDIQHIDESIIEIIEDMKETLNFTGGYGIAAPQIGINKRIVIIQVKKENCTYQDCEDIPTTVMINPVWKNLSKEKYI